jgi:hypothetical protein
MFFLLFLLDDKRIRIQIPEQRIRMRIRDAQKHMGPTDPDLQHCLWISILCDFHLGGKPCCLTAALVSRCEVTQSAIRTAFTALSRSCGFGSHTAQNITYKFRRRIFIRT